MSHCWPALVLASNSKYQPANLFLFQDAHHLDPKEKLHFSYPYSQYPNGDIPHFDYGGAALLEPDYIQLVHPHTPSVGWITTSQPQPVDAKTQVFAEFFLKPSPQQDPAQTHKAGGGVAVFYSATPARAIGHLYGNDENFRGIGVFMDAVEATPGQLPRAYITAVSHEGGEVGQRRLGTCYANIMSRDDTIRLVIKRDNSHVTIYVSAQTAVDVEQKHHVPENQELYQRCIVASGTNWPETGFWGVNGVSEGIGMSQILYRFSVHSEHSLVQERGLLVDDLVIPGGADPNHPSEPELRRVSASPQASIPERAAHYTAVPPVHEEELHLPDRPFEHVLNVVNRLEEVLQQAHQELADWQSVSTFEHEKVLESLSSAHGYPENPDHAPENGQLDDDVQRKMADLLNELYSFEKEYSRLRRNVEEIARMETEQLTAHSTTIDMLAGACRSRALDKGPSSSLMVLGMCGALTVTLFVCLVKIFCQNRPKRNLL